MRGIRPGRTVSHKASEDPEFSSAAAASSRMAPPNSYTAPKHRQLSTTIAESRRRNDDFPHVHGLVLTLAISPALVAEAQSGEAADRGVDRGVQEEGLEGRQPDATSRRRGLPYLAMLIRMTIPTSASVPSASRLPRPEGGGDSADRAGGSTIIQLVDPAPGGWSVLATIGYAAADAEPDVILQLLQGADRESLRSCGRSATSARTRNGSCRWRARHLGDPEAAASAAAILLWRRSDSEGRTCWLRSSSRPARRGSNYDSMRRSRRCSWPPTIPRWPRHSSWLSPR